MSAFDYDAPLRDNYDPNRVRPAKCATCPFRDGSPLSNLRAEISAKVLTAHNHYCHAEQLTGAEPSWGCRGSRDLQLEAFFRLGVLAEATDECWARTLANLTGGNTDVAEP